VKQWLSAGMTMVFFFTAGAAALPAEEPPLTVLDQTLRSAEANSDLDGLYYRAFLSVYLYIPTTAAVDPNGGYSPLAYEMDGDLYVMLFDTLDRLNAWAGGREIPYARLPGYALVEAADLNTHWALNVGTDHVKLFIPDEIRWLKESVAEFRRRVAPMDAGTEVEYRVADEVSEKLSKALKSALKNNTQVRAAFLATVQAMDKSFEQKLVLVLVISPEGKKQQDAILMNLDSAAQSVLQGDQELSLAVADENDPGTLATRIARDLVPFYQNRY